MENRPFPIVTVLIIMVITAITCTIIWAGFPSSKKSDEINPRFLRDVNEAYLRSQIGIETEPPKNETIESAIVKMVEKGT